jgi:tetratricopeptide (TPR) repeat protein
MANPRPPPPPPPELPAVARGRRRKQHPREQMHLDPTADTNHIPGEDIMASLAMPASDHVKPRPWTDATQKQLRSMLSAACKRMPRNAEAHFHYGLLHLRNADGEEALRAFHQSKRIYEDRERRYIADGIAAPQRLVGCIARLRAHTAQAAHLAAATRLSRDERAPLLDRLQKDLVHSTNLDATQPDVWNALALLHLSEGGIVGARDLLQSICESFPTYLDAVNNLGLAELAIGNEQAATNCFQKVILADRYHAAAMSNYGVVLLRNGVYEKAARTFLTAVSDAKPNETGLASAWGGLAIARSALGLMREAEEAAREAERAADPVSRPRFTMLHMSIRARRVTTELRRGVASDGKVSTFTPVVRAAATALAFTASQAAPLAQGQNQTGQWPGPPLPPPPSPLPVSSVPTLPLSRPLLPEKLTVPCVSGHGTAAPPAGLRIRCVADEATDDEDEDDEDEDDVEVGNVDAEAPLATITSPPATPSFKDADSIPEDPRPLMDVAVTRLRCVVRETRSPAANAALGAILRLRHDYSWDEPGNRNFGTEAAERLVDAIEGDSSDASAWVQLALLQMSSGEYSSARDFCSQAVARSSDLESGWNALAVSYQLSNEIPDALRSYEKAAACAITHYSRKRVDAVAAGEPIPESAETDESDDALPDSSAFISSAGFKGGGATTDDEEEEDDVMMGDPLGVLTASKSRSRRCTYVSLFDDENISKVGRHALAAIYSNIGNLRRQQGNKFDEAQAAYEKSLVLGGENAAVYNNLALLYITEDRMDDAEKMLSHSLTIDSHFECAVSNLLKLRRLRDRRKVSDAESAGIKLVGNRKVCPKVN